MLSFKSNRAMRIFLSIFLIVLVLPLWSQDSETRVKCHTSEMTEKLIEEHPEITQVIEEAEAELELSRWNPNLAKDGDIYTIPVVFHVVHQGGSENISFEQIQNAIDVMNEDYSATNLGASNVHPAFTNLVADIGIRFALAKRDPQGNCTNGVVRTFSLLTTEGNESLKEISPIWDRSRYLNIWVCRNIASGAAGYAYYPTSVAGAFGTTNDGIVVRYDYVGAIGESSYSHSHVLSHEAGHWMDLPHLWGSTNSPEDEGNCFTDDGISDTPNTIGWTTCNINGESCGSLDNVENFMEYSYCGKMFTLGQSQRMRNALESGVAQRSNLWQEENIQFTGVNEEPVLCLADFAADKRVICVGESVEFTDMSFSGVSQRSWTFEGAEPSTSSNQQPVVTYSEPGVYNVGVSVGDGVEQLSVFRDNYIRVLDTIFSVLPFEEDFENTPPLNSSINDIWFTDNEDWEITDQASYDGNKSVFINGYEMENGIPKYLYSQTFDLSDLTENAVLSFKYACARRSFSSNAQLRVWISKNCGEHWSLRETINDDDIYTVSGNYSQPYFPDSEDEWNTVVIDNISSVFFHPDFRLRFEYTSTNGNNLFIDHINLVDGAPPLSVSDVDNFPDRVKIFPNPTTNQCIVELDLKEPESQLEMNLVDLSGRQLMNIYEGSMPEGNRRLNLDLSGMETGVYLLQFNTSSGSYARKIVKSN